MHKNEYNLWMGVRIKTFRIFSLNRPSPHLYIEGRAHSKKTIAFLFAIAEICFVLLILHSNKHATSTPTLHLHTHTPGDCRVNGFCVNPKLVWWPEHLWRPSATTLRVEQLRCRWMSYVHVLSIWRVGVDVTLRRWGANKEDISSLLADRTWRLDSDIGVRNLLCDIRKWGLAL